MGKKERSIRVGCTWEIPTNLLHCVSIMTGEDEGGVTFGYDALMQVMKTSEASDERGGGKLQDK